MASLYPKPEVLVEVPVLFSILDVATPRIDWDAPFSRWRRAEGTLHIHKDFAYHPLTNRHYFCPLCMDIWASARTRSAAFPGACREATASVVYCFEHGNGSLQFDPVFGYYNLPLPLLRREFLVAYEHSTYRWGAYRFAKSPCARPLEEKPR